MPPVPRRWKKFTAQELDDISTALARGASEYIGVDDLWVKRINTISDELDREEQKRVAKSMHDDERSLAAAERRDKEKADIVSSFASQPVETSTEVEVQVKETADLLQQILDLNPGITVEDAVATLLRQQSAEESH